MNGVMVMMVNSESKFLMMNGINGKYVTCGDGDDLECSDDV